MLCVGLDLHERTSTLAILDLKETRDSKRMSTRTIKGSWTKVLAELREVKEDRGDFDICYEASTSYGVLHDALADVANRVVVAHPSKLEAIYKSRHKNDRNDAKTLAGLLALDIVPAVHVPRQDVRGWRRLINYRYGLVKDRTRVKNRIRALLRSQGIAAPKNLWTKKARAWLRTVDFNCVGDALMRDECLDRLETVENAIRRVEAELDVRAAKHPGVAILRTIPGVGPRTAEAMVAWIDDPRRFRSVRCIGNYLGLVPCEDTSAGRRRLGHMTKEGPPVIRWLLTQAAWQVVARVPEVRAFRDRVMKGDPDRKKIATVAVMHYLARAMLAMLRDGSVWEAAL